MTVSNYKELLEHFGHELEIADYGGENVCIECLECGIVLVEFQNEEINQPKRPENMPIWVWQYLNHNFYQFSGGGSEGHDMKEWKLQAKKWIEKFLKAEFSDRSFDGRILTNLQFTDGFCEFWVDFTINGQRWHMIPGDPRFRVCDWMTLNKVNENGGRGGNLNIHYNDSFVHNLLLALKLGSGLTPVNLNNSENI